MGGWTRTVARAGSTAPGPDRLEHRVAAFPSKQLAVESGRIGAGPRVLHRAGNAVVVFQRLTIIRNNRCPELLSMARSDPADAIKANFFGGGSGRSGSATTRTGFHAAGPGVAIAVVREDTPMWLQPDRAASADGRDGIRTTAQFVVDGPWPQDEVLSLVIAWPAGGLADARVDLPLARFRQPFHRVPRPLQRST